MTVFDWLAVLGAGSWLPTVGKWIKDYFTKPEVRVITQPAPELGFSTFGPILNIRVAFVVRHRDLVISGLGFRLRHEDGEERMFVWQGIIQHLGQMRPPVGSAIPAIPFEKQSSVLAIKVTEKDVEERFIQFHEADFVNAKVEYEARAAKKLVYEKSQREVDPEQFLRSPEMMDLYAFIRQSFSWKPGRYELTFILQSPDSFNVLDDVYEFDLTPLDIENLEKNRELTQDAYREQVFPPTPEQGSKLVWNWCYPRLRKLT